MFDFFGGNIIRILHLLSGNHVLRIINLFPPIRTINISAGTAIDAVTIDVLNYPLCFRWFRFKDLCRGPWLLWSWWEDMGSFVTASW